MQNNNAITRYWYLTLARNLKIVAMAMRYDAGRTWVEDEIRGAA